MEKLIPKCLDNAGGALGKVTPANKDSITVDPNIKKPTPTIKAYSGEVTDDPVMQEFLESDYIPRLKRLNPKITDEELTAARKAFLNTGDTYEKTPKGIEGGLAGADGVTWKSPTGELPRWVTVHEVLGHRVRQHGLGKVAGSPYSSDNLKEHWEDKDGNLHSINFVEKLQNFAGFKGFGSGYTSDERKKLEAGWGNLQKRRFAKTDEGNEYRKLVETGAINTQTRYRIWRDLRAYLKRTPTLEEVNHAIDIMPSSKMSQYVSGKTNVWGDYSDMYTGQLMNPNSVDSNGNRNYLGGIEDYNALKTSLKDVALNDVQNNDISYAKMGTKLIKKAYSGSVLNFLQQLLDAGYDLGTSGKNHNGVDGAWGDATNKAWELAQKDGYINQNGKLVKKTSKKSTTDNQGNLNNILQSIISRLSGDRDIIESNPESIDAHMKSTKGNYTVVDKKNNKTYYYSNGKLIKTVNNIIGARTGDGYTVTSDEKNYLAKSRLTGAGVYTIRQVQRPGDGSAQHYYNNEPMIILNNAKGLPVSLALHGPVSGGKFSGSRQSAGCVRNPDGTITYLDNLGFFNEKDSVLILPEEEGNYIYNDNGIFRTHFGTKTKGKNDKGQELDVQYNENYPTIIDRVISWFK